MKTEHDYEIGLFLEGGASGRTMDQIKDNDTASGVASGVIYMTPNSEDIEEYPTIVVAIGPRVSDTDKSMAAVMKRANNIRKAFDAVAARLYKGEKMSSTPRLYDKEGRVYDLTTSGIQLERVKTLCIASMGEDYREDTLFFLPRPEETQVLESTSTEEADTPVRHLSEPQRPPRYVVPSNGPEITLSVFRINI